VSLLVAANDGSRVWMLSDTAISGGVADLRSRTDYPKIEPSNDGRALIGFAGDKHHGGRIAKEAAIQPAGAAGLDVLRRGHIDRQHSVDFLYGFVDSSGAHLKRIVGGKIDELPTAHIGNTAAFAHIQAIRHRAQIDPIPLSLQTFICGLKGSEQVPRELEAALVAMIRLFAERQERDVGGWPLAYVLTSGGPIICQYGYSASDPIFDRIAPDSAVPHGTAECGGYGLSVTEFGDLEGIVVYQLQRPGGTVYVRTADGYEAKKFAGLPEVFTAAASHALGRPVHVWFSNQPFGSPRKIAVLYDERGNAWATVADDGDRLMASVIDITTPFRTNLATLSLSEEAEMQCDGEGNCRIEAKLDDGKDLITLTTRKHDQLDDSIKLSAEALELLISQLGRLRASMNSEVSREPKIESGVGYMVVPDPIWRTKTPPPPPLDGILLKLRHPGFGWQTFLLPHHEATSLGSWLCEHSNRPSTAAAAQPDPVADLAGRGRQRGRKIKEIASAPVVHSDRADETPFSSWFMRFRQPRSAQ
jgi:hypothetical protein